MRSMHWSLQMTKTTEPDMQMLATETVLKQAEMIAQELVNGEIYGM